MSTVAVPRRVVGGADDLVIVSRTEYESLLRARAEAKGEESMTPAVRRALLRTRKNLNADKMLSIDDVKRKLASRG